MKIKDKELECVNCTKLEQKINDIKKCHKVQSRDVACDYMRGVFNGLELAMSILESRKVKFK